MVTNVKAGFGAGERHGWIDAMCTRFEAIVNGDYAQAILNGDYGPLPTRGQIVTLPAWLWGPPTRSVGRKAAARGGGTLHLPTRVTWHGGPVQVIAAGTETTCEWSAVGVSGSGAGSATLATTNTAASEINELGTNGLPVRITARAVTRPKMRKALAELVEAGKAAKWEAIVALEPFVERACARALANISNELGGGPTFEWEASGATTRVLDNVSVEKVRDEMLLGSDTHPGAVHQLLNRCLRPGSFRNVDPLRYISDSIRRDAEDAMRREIGDPRIGPKVRRMFRERPTSTLPELLQRYNAAYPADNIGSGRAARALLHEPAAATPFSAVAHRDDWSPLDDLHIEPSFEDSSDDHQEAMEELAALLAQKRYRSRMDEVIADVAARHLPASLYGDLASQIKNLPSDHRLDGSWVLAAYTARYHDRLSAVLASRSIELERVAS